MENKSGEDDVFDRLNTAILNKYLQELMEGLTAKVFRTYNASRTLQEQLNLLTEPEDPIPAKILSYNRANRAVAILCNHQRAAPKNFSKQMENLQVKIDDKKASIKEAKKLMKDAKSDYKNHKSEKTKRYVQNSQTMKITSQRKTKSALEKRKKAVQRLEEQLTKLEVQATDKEENKEIALGTSKLNYLDPRISVACALEKRKKAVQRLEEQLTKLEVQATDKEENKEIALGTSKLNYLDPRISVAWCKKWEVPIEKIYNKMQREKFRWAIDMATAEFEF
ncbi:hypothetical protein FSP39_019006 [Pinctada imbricata]|uniref:DNA topoisomerase n=1 Tax=Pinctada imbricata TaxID=66713 RepID=A0AA88XIU9_PINIB|nr:hypothetical protein FSP39_019006 [Pinctada imbricata]